MQAEGEVRAGRSRRLIYIYIYVCMSRTLQRIRCPHRKKEGIINSPRVDVQIFQFRSWCVTAGTAEVCCRTPPFRRGNHWKGVVTAGYLCAEPSEEQTIGEKTAR